MDLPGFSLDFSSLSTARLPDPGETYDMLIIGGGPAALSATIYGARKLVNLAVLTVNFGGQMLDTSEIENYLGFSSIDADELVSRFKEHVKNFDIPVSQGVAVAKVEKEGDLFTARMEGGTAYRGRTVVYATGMHHRRLGVPGERELTGRGVAYCATCDAPFFRDKKVVVAGGGNSALTAARDLLKVNARVTVINHAEGWQGDPALMERVREMGKVDFLDRHEVLRIEGEDRVAAVAVRDLRADEEKSLEADGIFIEIGWLPNTAPVRDLALLSDRQELRVDCSSSTSVPGLFGAGDVTTVPHKQIIISAGEGAKAALSAYNYLAGKSLI